MGASWEARYHRGVSTAVFVDKSPKPDATRLAAALGRARPHWDAILTYASAAAPKVKSEWKFYKTQSGWILKVSTPARALMWMVPHRGSFLVSMALREAAVEAVRDSKLPRRLVRELEAAPDYPEGRPVRIEVSKPAHVATVKALIRFKAPQ